MQGCQTICCPCNRIGLSWTGRVLNQIIVSWTILTHICNQLTHYIQLMKSRENQTLLCNILSIFLFGLHLKADELLDNIQQAVLLQYIFPDIRCYIIIIFCLRIPCTTVISGTVGTLIEWQEICICAFQFRSHPCFVKVYCEICENTMIQPKCRFPLVTVILPLQFCIIYGLSCQLIL